MEDPGPVEERDSESVAQKYTRRHCLHIVAVYTVKHPTVGKTAGFAGVEVEGCDNSRCNWLTVLGSPQRKLVALRQQGYGYERFDWPLRTVVEMLSRYCS
jgi:hypothetical protein